MNRARGLERLDEEGSTGYLTGAISNVLSGAANSSPNDGSGTALQPEVTEALISEPTKLGPGLGVGGVGADVPSVGGVGVDVPNVGGVGVEVNEEIEEAPSGGSEDEDEDEEEVPGFEEQPIELSPGLGPKTEPVLDPKTEPVLSSVPPKASLVEKPLDVNTREKSNQSNLDALVEKIKSGKIQDILVVVGPGVSNCANVYNNLSKKKNLRGSTNGKKEGVMFAGGKGGADFEKEPQLHYKILKDAIPENSLPSKGHAFIRLLQDKDLLLRLYSENHDPLEVVAGIRDDKALPIYGRIDSMKCSKCNKAYKISKLHDALKNDVNDPKFKPPKCNAKTKNWFYKDTQCDGVLIPDCNEKNRKRQQELLKLAKKDSRRCNLLLVMGTNMEVPPFDDILPQCRLHVPRLLINKKRVALSASNYQQIHQALDPNCEEAKKLKMQPTPMFSLSGRDSGFGFDDPTNLRDVLMSGDINSKVDELCVKLGWKSELDKLVESYKLDNKGKSIWQTMQKHLDENEDSDDDQQPSA